MRQPQPPKHGAPTAIDQLQLGAGQADYVLKYFLDVSAVIMEHEDPVFYGDPKTVAMKVLGLT